jgi:DNA polymerase III gamma/tau subunit
MDNQTSPIIDEKQVHEICQQILSQQRTDIIGNLRTFARHDMEIQYFLNKIIDLLKDDLDEERKYIIKKTKEKLHEIESSSHNQICQGLSKIDAHVEKRIAKIVKSPPYDEISASFLASLRQQWQQEYARKYESEIANIKGEINGILAMMFLLACIFLSVSMWFHKRIA